VECDQRGGAQWVVADAVTGNKDEIRPAQRHHLADGIEDLGVVCDESGYVTIPI